MRQAKKTSKAAIDVIRRALGHQNDTVAALAPPLPPMKRRPIMAVKITPAKALTKMFQSINKAQEVSACRIPDKIKEKWQATVNAQRSIHEEALRQNEKWEEIKNGK